MQNDIPVKAVLSELDKLEDRLHEDIWQAIRMFERYAAPLVGCDRMNDISSDILRSITQEHCHP